MSAFSKLLRGSALQEFPLVHQRCDSDCGLAALATIAAFHGCPLSYDHFADHIALDSRGMNLLTLSQLANRIGLPSQGIKASYDDIPNCVFPIIAHTRHWVGGGHFVVIYRWTPAHVILGNPAKGLRTMSRRVFCRRSTGYFLTFKPHVRLVTADAGNFRSIQPSVG